MVDEDEEGEVVDDPSALREREEKSADTNVLFEGLGVFIAEWARVGGDDGGL